MGDSSKTELESLQKDHDTQLKKSNDEINDQKNQLTSLETNHNKLRQKNETCESNLKKTNENFDDLQKNSEIEIQDLKTNFEQKAEAQMQCEEKLSNLEEDEMKKEKK